jgi:hypothetical protein
MFSYAAQVWEATQNNTKEWTRYKNDDGKFLVHKKKYRKVIE